MRPVRDVPIIIKKRKVRTRQKQQPNRDTQLGDFVLCTNLPAFRFMFVSVCHSDLYWDPPLASLAAFEDTPSFPSPPPERTDNEDAVRQPAAKNRTDIVLILRIGCVNVTRWLFVFLIDVVCCAAMMCRWWKNLCWNNLMHRRKFIVKKSSISQASTYWGRTQSHIKFHVINISYVNRPQQPILPSVLLVWYIPWLWGFFCLTGFSRWTWLLAQIIWTHGRHAAT